MNTTKILTFVSALLLAGIGFGLWSQSASVAAAEAEGSERTAAEDAAGDTPGSEATDSDATAGAPSSEVFIPTEEISEDFAVSFPVDI